MSDVGASREQLRGDLKALGLQDGAVVFVHSSLRRTKPDGGAATVAAALQDVIGLTGTIVVYVQTPWNSTTSRVHRAETDALTPAQAKAHLATKPLFDPQTTPSDGTGALAEFVRTMPGAVRSTHPQTSFAAVGAQAAELMAVHDVSCHLGPRSPLEVLYERDAVVLFLGTGYQTCTMFHLAEYRYAELPQREYQARSVLADPADDWWLGFYDIDLDDSDFGQLGEDFERACAVALGRVGSADARLFRCSAAVDYAVDWMRRERAFQGIAAS